MTNKYLLQKKFPDLHDLISKLLQTFKEETISVLRRYSRK